MKNYFDEENSSEKSDSKRGRSYLVSRKYTRDLVSPLTISRKAIRTLEKEVIRLVRRSKERAAGSGRKRVLTRDI